MREILLIDDKYQKWHRLLEKEAQKNDFSIAHAISVEEGLKKLEDYPGHTEAVIMGLSYTTGTMQGMEGLLKIRELDVSLPVIVLTAKTDDLQLVTECIRSGAYDYFSKSTLNPELLFLQVEKAVRQSKQQKKFNNLTKTFANHQNGVPAFLTVGDLNSKTVIYFAYKLDAVACVQSENRYEAEFVCQLAYEWQRDFLHALSFYDPGLRLRLRYIISPGQEFIEPAVIIECKVRSEDQARIRFEELQQEIGLFMRPKKDFGNTIYYFSPVTEKEKLQALLFPFTPRQFVRYVPEFTGFAAPSRKRVGFSPAVVPDQEKMALLPVVSKLEPKLDGFCEKLLNQKSNTMVEIVMTPLKLSKSEIDYLRESLRIVDSYYISDTGKAKAEQALSACLENPSQCYQAEIFCACESSGISKTLLSAVLANFFPAATQVNKLDISPATGIILKNEDGTDNGRDWNTLYSMKNIANVFKLPYPVSPSIPGIRSYIPINGYVPENLVENGIIAGSKNVNGMDIPVRIGEKDLRTHLYLMGQTGTGKTSVLYSMIMDSIKTGKGVCVIDPHGDLYKKIIANIPESRKNDLIRFEPDNPDNQIRINLLEYEKDNPRDKSRVVDELFNFFRQEYSKDSMGPIFEYYMKNALLLLTGDPERPGNIGDLAAVFQNGEFRNELVKKCTDKSVATFWKETAEKTTGDYTLVNFTPYIVSKLNQLTMNEYISPIVATSRSNLDFREIIDSGKILLVSLPKGNLGKIGVNILGMVILSRLVNAALSRVDLAEDERKDFILFVDEFQNFVSESLMNGLAENRKFRLSMVLANQTLGQLTSDIKQSLLGNAGSRIFFRPGINDIDYIMPYVTPYVSRENLLTLPNFKCIARIQINNTLSLPFIFDTVPYNN